MKLEATYIDKKWDILEFTDHSEQKSYFSRHNCCSPGSRPWMMALQRVCHNCQIAIPDHIQALMVLLTWGEKNEI